MKKLIIKWAIKQIKGLSTELTFEDLSMYGISDITIDARTGEKCYYFD